MVSVGSDTDASLGVGRGYGGGCGRLDRLRVSRMLTKGDSKTIGKQDGPRRWRTRARSRRSGTIVLHSGLAGNETLSAGNYVLYHVVEGT